MDASFLDECIEELQLYSMNQILSEEQLNIFGDKLNGMTAASIMSFYRLSKNAYIHCMTRTVEGRTWHKGMPGGGYPYLGEIDMMKFSSVLSNAADELNCVCTSNAMSLAIALKKEKFNKARFLLLKCGCSGLID